MSANSRGMPRGPLAAPRDGATAWADAGAVWTDDARCDVAHSPWCLMIHAARTDVLMARVMAPAA